MALYTPPGKSSSRPTASEGENDKRDDPKDDINKFYVRPSLGLRLWGPLVPASDNKVGLWSLVGIQTLVGLFCMYRIKGLRSSFKIVRKDIADIPSLNRFSTTHGELVMSPPRVGAAELSAPAVGQNVSSKTYDGTSFGGVSSFFKSSSHSSGKGFFQSFNFATLRKVIYLLTGTLILSQSMLETCRLTILKYDPWCEEAKSIRDKKFFNDIIQFYHEGIDPTKVKVKDATNGNIMPTNIPEVKQSVALVRAQAESENPIIKWYGPLEYKPMSFTEYLDRLEYHLDMFEFLQDKRNIKESSIQFMNNITHTQAEVEGVVRKNEENRHKIHEIVSNAQKGSMPLSQKAQGYPLRGIVLDPSQQDAKSLDLEEIWTLYDPWMNLALDTSLSIKFLPTVTPNEVSEGSVKENHDSKDETETNTE